MWGTNLCQVLLTPSHPLWVKKKDLSPFPTHALFSLFSLSMSHLYLWVCVVYWIWHVHPPLRLSLLRLWLSADFQTSADSNSKPSGSSFESWLALRHIWLGPLCKSSPIRECGRWWISIEIDSDQSKLHKVCCFFFLCFFSRHERTSK